MRFFATTMLVAIAVLGMSCSMWTDGEVSMNVDDEIERQQNITFTFSKPMVPDSLVTDTWDTTSYVVFTPRVAGQFQWISPTELVFSPSIGFAAATAYTAELTKAVLRHAASTSMPTHEPLAFHTPWLAIDDAIAQWNRNDVTGAVEAVVTITFNYDVDPAHVMQAMRVTADGTALPARLRSEGQSSTVVVAVDAASVSADGGTLALTLRKGLRCVGGGEGTREDRTASVDMPSRRTLEILSTGTSWRGSDGVVDVYTSQAIDVATLTTALISVKPSVAVTLEPSSTGFRIVGAFDVNTQYTINVKPGLKGVVGGVLTEHVEETVTFQEMRPEISFTSSRAMYLGARGAKGIGVRIVNVPTVRITVFRIYENNIAHLLHNARSYSWDSEEDDGVVGYDVDYVDMSMYADTVYTRTHNAADLGRDANGVAVYQFDVKQHTDRKGMYLVKIQSTEDQWIESSKLVAVSDVGLIAKQGLNDLAIFANSIRDASPLRNVTLSLYSTNHQLVETITTGGDGVAVLRDLRSKLGPFTIGMITARYGDDFTFLYLRDTKVDAGRFATGGLHENAAGLQAYVYGDRNLYRPGETIHLNTIVRDRSWKAAGGVPLTLRLLAPDGQELQRMRLMPDAEGSAPTDIPMSASAVTGIYRVEIYSATEVLLTSYNVAVEEFLPDRLKVATTFSVAQIQPGVPFDVTVDASTFVGTPAAKRRYELAIHITAAEFAPKKYPGYAFAVSTGDVSSMRRIERSGTLDEQGHATERVLLDDSLKNTGLLRARVYVTVFDETGRPVRAFEQRDVRTQPAMLGLKRMERYVSVRQPVSLPVIACGYDGALASATARVRILRNEWHTVLEEGHSGYRYVTQKRVVTLSDQMMTVQGADTRVTFTPTISGEYEVHVGMPQGAAVTTTVYAFGYGFTQASSFPVNTEGFVDITLDKPSYRPGETANILFTTPFAGTLIVTVERDGVLEHHTVTTDKRSASLRLPVRDTWVPNAYIAATLIKPHVHSDMPLTVAHGYQPIVVERASSRLAVAITAPSTSRSRRKQTIDVRTTPGAKVTIAVVDEGIMQVRNTPTPDPHAYFYQKRALQVESYDMYPLLFPELRIRKQAYGAGDDMARRLNPFTVKRANLVTYWSGVLHAANGKASVTIDLPAFTGSLRVMAVAYKGQAFGSATHMMTVSDPLTVSTPLPRVVAPGDTVYVPVVLANTTQQTMQATCALRATGPLKVLGEKQQLRIMPGKETVAMFTMVGTGLGPATITTTASALGETYTQQTEIAVRPVTPLTERSGAGSVQGGQTDQVQIPASFVAGTARGRLVVSTFPAVHVVRNLAKLVTYPYGCVEQTISKAFPQIYLADLVKAWQGAALTADPLRNVQEAVRSVERMQTYSGGVSYWPGGSEVTWWGTAYAAHFLQEARRAGHEVDQRALDRMLQYLAKQVRRREQETVRRYDADGVAERKQPARETFYSLFVLAAAGRQDVPTMNYWMANAQSMSQDSRYVLACTYLMLGDRATYRKLLPTTFRDERYRAFDGGSFASPLRDLALSLYALVVAAPDDPQTGTLARRLSKQVMQEQNLSTQEHAFAVLALGRLAQRTAQHKASAVITMNGSTIATIANGTTAVDVRPGATYRIAASGGTVYYTWVAEGIAADGSSPIEDRVLQVRRMLLDRKGQPIKGNTFTQHQLVVVKVTVRTLDNSVVDNVVVSDVLSAGFELENPRLGADTTTAFAKDGATAEYYDYRDDRMNLFVRAEGKPRDYYYVVRAISRGRFRMGPIGADAMYDDDIHSYHGGGSIVVR